ncbi:MAG: hypothetical protein DI585_05545 [Pseudomonas fluorescens]|nr:MAG: hypothetical protein DI585_05545 [Pseudomonas fluorescens]
MMVEALGQGHWPELYRLMVARNFPDVPPKYVDAVPYFRKARLYGLMEGSELAAGFVFGPPEDGVAYFDVVCTARQKGVWATFPVLRSLFDVAFCEMGLRCVWVQPENKVALKAALKAGFVAATPLDVEKPILVMTPSLLPRKFKEKRN